MQSLLNEDGSIKKIVIIFPLILLILIGVLIYINRDPYKNDYIIIDESLILQKRRGKYHKINSLDDNILSKKYNVISNGKKYEDVSIKYTNGTFYYLDKNYEDLNLKNVSVAYTKKYNIKSQEINYTYYEPSDMKYLKEVSGITDYTKLSKTLAKVTFDFDKSNNKETIYTANTMDFGISTGSVKSVLFVTKNNKLMQILDNKTNKIYYVVGIDDLDNNGTYELILSKGTVDNPTFTSTYVIYEMKNNKFNLIMEE